LTNILTNIESFVNSPFGVSPSDFATNFIFPLIFIVLTSVVSGIRLYYLSMQGRNRYIALLKRNFPHIEAFLNIKEKFKRISQVYSLECLFIGFFLGVFIVFFVNFIMLMFLNLIYNTTEYLIAPLGDIFIHYLHPFPLDAYLAILIISKFCLVFCNWLESNRFFAKKMTEFYELRHSQILIYYVSWILLGLNLWAYIFGFFAVSGRASPILNWEQYMLHFMVFFVLALEEIILYMHYTIYLIKKIKLFPIDVIEPITDYHQRHFPYTTIKTESNEAKGQLKDINNNSLSILGEKNALIILPWDTVKMMEACYQNECTIFDNDFINEK
jgi:hypothetical protein